MNAIPLWVHRNHLNCFPAPGNETLQVLCRRWEVIRDFVRELGALSIFINEFISKNRRSEERRADLLPP